MQSLLLKKLEMLNNAVPVVKNVGNAAFDLVGRGVKTADNIIDVAVDIPFKFARKIQDLGNRNVKNGVTQAVNCIRDVEIKSSLINNLRNNVASNTHRISNLEGIVSNHGQRISNLEGIVSNHGQRISKLEGTVDLHSRQIAHINSTLNEHGKILNQHGEMLNKHSSDIK